jgi:ATP-dependent RNA helicase DDX49/DBP8
MSRLCEMGKFQMDTVTVRVPLRIGRRGRAVSLIGERDVSLVHACEQMSGREMKKCEEVDDDLAVKMLSAVTKASKLARMKLDDIGFDELVKKMKERKIRDRKERERASRAARKTLKKARGKI